MVIIIFAFGHSSNKGKKVVVIIVGDKIITLHNVGIENKIEIHDSISLMQTILFRILESKIQHHKKKVKLFLICLLKQANKHLF
jgi:hypothetical protein